MGVVTGGGGADVRGVASGAGVAGGVGVAEGSTLEPQKECR